MVDWRPVDTGYCELLTRGVFVSLPARRPDDNQTNQGFAEFQVAGANRRWRWPFRCRGSRRESAVAQLFSLGGTARMKDSSKRHSPERSLIIAMIFCVFCSLALISVPALLYLQGREHLKVSPLASSVSIATYDSVADLVHWLMFDMTPIISFCFLIVGYVIFDAYRKIKTAKDKDNGAA